MDVECPPRAHVFAQLVPTGGTIWEDGEPLGAGIELEKVSLREVDLEV